MQIEEQKYNLKSYLVFLMSCKYIMTKLIVLWKYSTYINTVILFILLIE